MLFLLFFAPDTRPIMEENSRKDDLSWLKY